MLEWKIRITNVMVRVRLVRFNQYGASITNKILDVSLRGGHVAEAKKIYKFGFNLS